METFSALLALCGGKSTGWFPSQRSVTRSFDVFFLVRLNKRLSKLTICWWFGTPWRTLWRHCNEERNTRGLDSWVTLTFTLQNEKFYISWWRHQMETFSALLALCAVNSPHKGQWHGALMFSLICAWIHGWVNNREVGDLRRHRAHYDVTVMHGQSMRAGLPPFCPRDSLYAAKEVWGTGRGKHRYTGYLRLWFISSLNPELR